MKIVVDTNIIFSSLLRNNHPFLEHILLSDFSFYSINDIFIEIYKYKEKIRNNSKLSEEDIIEVLNKIFGEIVLFNIDFISIKNRKSAYDMCKNIDVKDTPFVGLTLELDALLWTGDKKLIDGLSRLGFDRFYKI